MGETHVKYLFDTDTITNLFKKQPSQNLVEKINLIDPNQQFISTITVFEIVFGAHKSEHTAKHLNNLEKILLPNISILSFDLKSSYVCGKLQAELNNQGTPLFLADLQIASIALANQATLVTGNIKHFQRIKQLNIENWI